MNASTQARLTLAGVAATMLAALTLSPLVRGKAWLVAVFVVVAVVAGVGAAVRQVTRSWLLVTLAQAGAFALAVTALFARDAALWGVLPGPGVWAEIRDLLAAGGEITRNDAPPVDPARGLILLVAGGVGLVGLAVDVIAVSLRKPAVAGLPLLAVYCVPAAVLPDGVSWAWFVVAALGFLLLVVSDSTDRIRGWGRVLGNLGADGEGRTLSAGPLSGARRIAVGALALAVILPPLVPGLGESILGPGNGTGNGRGSKTVAVVNPILTLRQDLESRSDTPILTYRPDPAAGPERLRIVADTLYTGKTWAPPPRRQIPKDNRVQDGLGAPPGLSARVASTQRRITITAGDYAQNFLPLPYPGSRVDIEGEWLWDAATLNVVGIGTTTRNKRYSANYVEVSPTSDQLEGAPRPSTSLSKEYTALPADFPATLRERADAIAGTGSAYEKAVSLQKYFREDGGFRYDVRAPVGNGGNDGDQDILVRFLEVKRGYCVHFASAMAVMARALGIPARVAVGFLPGTRGRDGLFSVSLRDAHAWPELYFEGVGWVPFEPTPAARVGTVPGYTTGDAAPTQTATATATRSAAPSASATPSRRPGQLENLPGVIEQPPLYQRVLAAIPWRLVVALAVLVGLGLVPLVTATVVRRRRWGRADTARARAEAAWDELRERLGDLGVRWAASWTPRALQRRLASDHDLGTSQRAALSRLVGDLESARYMPPGAPGRDADELGEDVRTVADGVAASLSGGARRRARWFPRTGLTVLGGLARNVDAAADEAGRRAAALGEQVRHTVGAGRHGGSGGSGGSGSSAGSGGSGGSDTG